MRARRDHALGRNADVDDLNKRARERLAAAGLIGRDQLEICGRTFATGDSIITTRNDYRLGVLNGTRATITEADPSTGTIHARTSSRRLTLPWSYVASGHVAHAYAMTFHKAQGITVHSAFVLADATLDRPRAYTGLSRGTHQNALYITDPIDERFGERHAPEPANDAVSRARESMAACSTRPWPSTNVSVLSHHHNLARRGRATESRTGSRSMMPGRVRTVVEPDTDGRRGFAVNHWDATSRLMGNRWARTVVAST